VLELTAFVAGASIMAIEIVASRILAPFLGNSIIVWSSLIAVILAALSLGYMKGGRIADKHPSFGALSLILAAAAVLTAFVALARNVCLGAAVKIPDIRLAAIAAEIVLFAPVSFVLAMVSPFVIRLKMKEVGSAGATVGRLYAISTVGSIAGTLGAGFYLLAIIGSAAILLSIAGLLCVNSFLLAPKAFRRPKAATAILAALCGYAAPGTSVPYIQSRHLFETDTHYNHCLVYEGVDARTNRPIRSLVIDRYSRQSSIFTDRNDDLVLDYLKYFRLGPHFNPRAQRALLLGGGGFTYVRDFFQRGPQRSLDVVEIDPALEGIARRYFGLAPNPRLRVFPEDARTYLNRCAETYDLIFVDTFNSGTFVPPYLTTQETARRVYDLLAPDGVAMLNLMSAINGPRGRFFRAELATYRSVFPHVEALNVFEGADSFHNVILVAFKSPAAPNWTSDDPEMKSYLAHRWTGPVEQDMGILTDDFAPVEIYVARREGG
jgi:spermidine synthase